MVYASTMACRPLNRVILTTAAALLRFVVLALTNEFSRQALCSHRKPAYPLDDVNNLQASLQVPASLASTAYSDRRNTLFTSPESAVNDILGCPNDAV